MRDEQSGKRGHRDQRQHREHREHRQMNNHGMKELEHPPKLAQTFRRGRAIAFLDILNLKRSTLQRQLQEPELESIKQVISGELKATEAIIEEFAHMFQIHESGADHEKLRLDSASQEPIKEGGRNVET